MYMIVYIKKYGGGASCWVAGDPGRQPDGLPYSII